MKNIDVRLDKKVLKPINQIQCTLSRLRSFLDPSDKTEFDLEEIREEIERADELLSIINMVIYEYRDSSREFLATENMAPYLRKIYDRL